MKTVKHYSHLSFIEREKIKLRKRNNWIVNESVKVYGKNVVVLVKKASIKTEQIEN